MQILRKTNIRNKVFISKFLYRLLLGLVVFILGSNFTFICRAESRVQDYGEELVIVIDPGHGGENLGTIENGFEEKTMTFITAQAMYEELTKYDNVTVYMTRNDDRDLTLKERAEFASSVDADFLFSLHYNASENHTHFGSEIWISSELPYNAYGYQFGYAFMTEMEEMGLFLRGIKTKLGDNGDYYGVIREAVALSVPAVILEHCHVDEDRDAPYCATEEEWIAFGKKDALAVAKYFGLSSKSLGVDYSQDSLKLPKANEATFVQSTVRDETRPDVCVLELLEADYETGDVLIDVTATDYDSPLLYYDYSIDGGKTFSASIAWPGVDLLDEIYSDTFTLSLKIPSGVQPGIILRAYNLADLYIESNMISFAQEFIYNKGSDSAEGNSEGDHVPEENVEGTMSDLVERDRHSAGTVTFTPVELDVAEPEEGVSFLDFLIICLIVVIIIFFTVLLSQSITYKKRKRKRRQRIKELEDSINQPK